MNSLRWSPLLICLAFGPNWGSEVTWSTEPASAFGPMLANDGPFETTTLSEDGGEIRVALAKGHFAVEREVILHWVENAAKAVTKYHKRFPVKHVNLVIIPGGNSAVGHGVTYGGKLIRINVGSRATPAALEHDWTLTHEMFHLGFPDLDEKHLWMEEGMAVYLEPFARVKIGTLTPAELWKGMADGLPKGLPESSDQGLENTHTWGRTYWGGTLFWMLADIRLRQQTQNKRSLRTVMNAILDAGGDNTRHWTIEQVLTTADKASGTNVVSELYREMGSKSKTVDLPALWKSLGVKIGPRGKVEMDDTAELAEIRKAMLAE